MTAPNLARVGWWRSAEGRTADSSKGRLAIVTFAQQLFGRATLATQALHGSVCAGHISLLALLSMLYSAGCRRVSCTALPAAGRGNPPRPGDMPALAVRFKQSLLRGGFCHFSTGCKTPASRITPMHEPRHHATLGADSSLRSSALIRAPPEQLAVSKASVSFPTATLPCATMSHDDMHYRHDGFRG